MATRPVRLKAKAKIKSKSSHMIEVTVTYKRGQEGWRWGLSCSEHLSEKSKRALLASARDNYRTAQFKGRSGAQYYARRFRMNVIELELPDGKIKWDVEILSSRPDGVEPLVPTSEGSKLAFESKLKALCRHHERLQRALERAVNEYKSHFKKAVKTVPNVDMLARRILKDPKLQPALRLFDVKVLNLELIIRGQARRGGLGTARITGY